MSLVSVVFKAPAMWERESLYETSNVFFTLKQQTRRGPLGAG